MRLNNSHRSAFVHSVMNDTPAIDNVSRVQALINKSLAETLDENIKALLRSPSRDVLKELTVYTRIYDDNFPRYLYGIVQHQKIGSTVSYLTDIYEIVGPEAQAQIQDLINEQINNSKMRVELKLKLEGIVKACTTDTQLEKALPEFEEYIPKEGVKTKDNLPAVANLITDFTKLGWPKDKQTEVATC